jgi:hypothetical protein
MMAHRFRGGSMQNGEQRAQQQRPHHDHYVWKTAYKMKLRAIEMAIAAEKRGRDEYGHLRHPRRMARMKAEARMLNELRRDVRGLMSPVFAKRYAERLAADAVARSDRAKPKRTFVGKTAPSTLKEDAP